MQHLILAVLTLAALWAPSRFAVSSVTVSPDTLALAYGDRGLLTATCHNAYGDVVYCVGGLKWTVRDTGKVLRITTTGNAVEARGRATGTSWIVAKPLTGTSDSSKIVVTSGPPGPQPPTTPPTLASITMTPTTVSLASGTTQAFAVQGFTSTGVPMGVAPSFSATGGSISAGGVYTAGSSAGTFRAIATVGSLADTSTITIPATLVQLILSPSSASLATGGVSQQFTVSGLLSDGQTTGAIIPTWSATGGTVSTSGLYVSGGSAGTFRVIAASSGVADTAVITLTTSVACSGVQITPGQSIQSAVTANPAGTTFCIQAGSHHAQSVAAKNRDVFRCAPGAILNGDSTTAYAFSSSGGNPDSITIKGCRITSYLASAQKGAINGGGDTQSESTLRWTVDSNEIDHNNNIGIRVGSYMKIRWNNIHHNQKLNIGGVGDSVWVYGNNIDDGNYALQGQLGNEAGGSKFVFTNNLVLRKNNIRRNKGPGGWLDICNKGFRIDSNTVEDQLQEGIAVEVSYSGIVADNIVNRNGLGDTRRNAWPWGAGIAIAATGGDSLGVEVYGNVLTGNAHGIALIQQPRPDGTYGNPSMCTHLFVNKANHVHNNTIRWGTGTLTFAGAVTDAGDNAFFTSRGNTFENNTYVGVSQPIGVSGEPGKGWAWLNGWRTQAQWTGYGHDTPGGTFTP